MAIGLIGRKSGMTRVFTDEGVSVPVTVIEIEPNRVTQIKTPESDGYAAVQVTTGSAKQHRTSQPLIGHYAKAAAGLGRGLWEFRVDALDEALVLGKEFGVELFSVGQRVDIRGLSKGKGTAGAIKRWGFRGQDNSHGNSLSHRAPGSIGQCQTPGRVFKGKKMAGRLGNVRVTTQNLQVMRVDKQRSLLLIKGSVPGPAGGDVQVLPAVKAKGEEAGA